MTVGGTRCCGGCCSLIRTTLCVTQLTRQRTIQDKTGQQVTVLVFSLVKKVTVLKGQVINWEIRNSELAGNILSFLNCEYDFFSVLLSDERSPR